jgi:hypothetical protein
MGFQGAALVNAIAQQKVGNRIRIVAAQGIFS